MSSAELPRLLAIFLVVFDDLQGGKVAFEVPEGSVGGSYPTSSTYLEPSPIPPGSSLLSAAAHVHRTGSHFNTNKAKHAPLFDLSDVEQYILPRRPLVRHLVTICVEQCKVIGFPVWIDSQQYPRGRYMYNVCFAFERHAELTAYEPVVRKTGRVLRHMEETTFLLSNPDNELRLHSILEQIYEDLGSYSETSVLLDEANTLDLKLFPLTPNPAVVRDWDIPVVLGSLDEMRDESWDTTMYSLAACIDGKSSVKRLANMADIDLPLARECIQHLLFYGCIILHDLFQYTNSYALVGGNASLASMAHDDRYNQSAQAECEAYVSQGTPVTPFATLFKYYAKLRPALMLEDWIIHNRIDTSAIDIRRMISFGIIKGFLRRVQVFPIWLDHPSFLKAEEVRQSFANSVFTNRGRNAVPRPLSSIASHTPTPSVPPTPGVAVQIQKERDETPRPGGTNLAKHETHVDQFNKKGYPSSLPNLLDGEHSSDELCARYRVSYHQLVEYLDRIGHSDKSFQISNTDPVRKSPNATRFGTEGVSGLGRVVIIHV